ncbi:MAG: hypothetical protein FWD89_01660 [Firmicutes bacterium]|nr:hypothetical protein [Bacillota bacterium]MCL2770997.1 hypothetical protein [Bacillota bacterium]
MECIQEVVTIEEVQEVKESNIEQLKKVKVGSFLSNLERERRDYREDWGLPVDTFEECERRHMRGGKITW